MVYVLISKTGKVMVFGVKACAQLYQTINGGVVVSTFNNPANIERIKDSVTI